ncbi:MAG TPA: hypothetical protein VHS78_10985, partial [Candidatus Elarobacter sp.]|nr:hypothetical protein [Candidatus Elarobacter sp.]
FGLESVSPEELSDEQRVEPRIDKCIKCGRAIIWTRRSDADEIGSPIEPVSALDGNLMIVGFTKSLRKGVVVPHVRAVENIFELPDLSMLPAWTERKRWLHHGPFCKTIIRSEDMPSRNIDDDPDLIAAFHRRRDQARRQRFVGAFLRDVVFRLPQWTPSKVLSDAFTEYELGRINSHQLKAVLTYEPGLIGDFRMAHNDRHNRRTYRRQKR